MPLIIFLDEQQKLRLSFKENPNQELTPTEKAAADAFVDSLSTPAGRLLISSIAQSSSFSSAPAYLSEIKQDLVNAIKELIKKYTALAEQKKSVKEQQEREAAEPPAKKSKKFKVEAVSVAADIDEGWIVDQKISTLRDFLAILEGKVVNNTAPVAPATQENSIDLVSCFDCLHNALLRISTLMVPLETSKPMDLLTFSFTIPIVSSPEKYLPEFKKISAEIFWKAAQLCNKGKEIKQDHVVAAVKLYQLAAGLGLAKAQLNLGWAYYKGEGVKKDVSKAVRLCKLAVDQGDAEAQYIVASYCLNGMIVAKNCLVAARLFGLAAVQGHAKAKNMCYDLGTRYYQGKGVEKNFEEAARLFGLAAAQGHTRAQYMLGTCYYKGEGVKKKFEEAARLFKLVVAQGYMKAQVQYMLGMCYFHGEGVVKDRREAMRLFKLVTPQDDKLRAGIESMLYIEECFGRSKKDWGLSTLFRAPRGIQNPQGATATTQGRVAPANSF